MKYQVIDINSTRVIILKLEAEFVTGVNNNKVKDVFLSIPLFFPSFSFLPSKVAFSFSVMHGSEFGQERQTVKIKVYIRNRCIIYLLFINLIH